MKRSIFFTTLAVLIIGSSTYTHGQEVETISVETIRFLQSRGFRILGSHEPIRTQKRHKETWIPNAEVIQIEVSLDLNQTNFEPFYMNNPIRNISLKQTQDDTILVEDFEGDFPGSMWQISGDPTWGKTDYQKHNGSYSIWCAAGGDSGVVLGDGYPNNLKAMMIFGPFDLSDVNYSDLKLWYWLDTEFRKDWFFYMVSTDGDNFQGIGVSGRTGVYSGAWVEDELPLVNVPGLGNVTGNSQVWIAFLFESDSNATSNKGAFIDDVTITKRQINGIPIAGAISGKLSPDNNPYVAPSLVGVARGDSLEIQPGVEIRFEQGIEFVILGSLASVGTKSDSILFTSNSEQRDWWRGIIVDYSNDSSRIEYCRFEYASSAISSYNSNVIIANNLFIKGGLGIYIGTSAPRIISNTISGNKSYGIWIVQGSPFIEKNVIVENDDNGIVQAGFGSSKIIGNIVSRNKKAGVSAGGDLLMVDNEVYGNGSYGIRGGGIFLAYNKQIFVGNKVTQNGNIGLITDVEEVTIIGNVISQNSNSGIVVSGRHSSPNIMIVNNTIARNDGIGINLDQNRLDNTFIRNNIIAENKDRGLDFLEPVAFRIEYNDLFLNNPNFPQNTGDFGILVTTNSKGDSTDLFYNISLDPMFVFPDTNNFSLQTTSPCKDTGHSSDFFIDIDGTPNDMGAFGGSRLNINPTAYDFGKVIIGSSREISFNIKNFRKQDVILNNVQISDLTNYSLSQSDSITIPSYESTRITVNYQPKNQDTHSAKIMISSNDFYGTSTANIDLHGEGINGTDVSGSVSGTWTRSGSPYILSSNVRIRQGQKLIINPGVEVRFDGPYMISTGGQLEAIGAPGDSIVFTTHRFEQRFDGTGLSFSVNGDTSKLSYCIIEKMKNLYDPFVPGTASALSSGAPIVISHSRISNNFCPAIRISGTSGIIRESVICDNSGAAIEFWYSHGELTGSTIRKNGGQLTRGVNKAGVYCLRSPRIIIRNNLIQNNVGGLMLWECNTIASNNIFIENPPAPRPYNYSGGISVLADSLVLFNNTFYNHFSEWDGGALWVSSSAYLLANNNIYWNNQTSNYSLISTGTNVISSIQYSNVQGGWEGEGNIDTSPLFTNLENNYFTLQPNSPCIDAGNPDSVYNDPEDSNNPGFALAPAQGTVRNDMGAFGGPDVSSALITSVEEIPTSSPPITFELMQNYPNPFNPETTIRYQIPKEEKVRLEIYNILGQKVITLVDEKETPGSYSIKWDGKDYLGRKVSSGVYLYRLEVKDFVKVKKLVFVR